MKNPYDYQFRSLLQKYDSTQFKKDFFNDLLSSGRSSLNKKVKTFSLNNDTKNKVFKSLYPNSMEKMGMDSFIYKNNIDDDSAIATIIIGEDGSEDEANELAEYVSDKYSLDVEIYNGDQPVYSYLLSVE